MVVGDVRKTLSTPQITDAVVVGAGFAGIYMVHRLQQIGLDVIALEAGGSVGGTWYWNRYPGARCDTKSLGYCYSFSPEIWQEWEWTEEYATQPEIERYLNFVVDRLQIRKDIKFDSRVISAVLNESSMRWLVTTASGEQISSRYLFMATGGFSEPFVPAISGMDRFAGELYLTSRWPQHEVSFDGKQIGVIGTGSSGMQVISEIAQRSDFADLKVFQRTPNFPLPGNNGPLDPESQRAIKQDGEEFWKKVWSSGTGFVVDVPTGSVGELDDAEFIKRMDEAYACGGPTVLGWISDLLTNEDSNHRVAEYLRAKIGQRVADPGVAEMLKPRGYYVGSRRQLIENGYLEVYNNSRVHLVDVNKDPIVEITTTGIRTHSRSYDLDMIVMATGFDSGTGAILQAGLVGRRGVSLKDKWAHGPITYLGLMTNGFPNCFMIAGPGSPSIRSVVTGSIEQHVQWLGRLVEHMRESGSDVIEPSVESERRWSAHVAEKVDALLLRHDDTQYFGANVPGKPRSYLAYVGGVQLYRRICNSVADSHYEGFVFSDLGGETLGGPARDWSGPPGDAPSTSSSQLGTTVV